MEHVWAPHKHTFGNDAAEATMTLPRITSSWLPTPEKLPDRCTMVPVLHVLHDALKALMHVLTVVMLHNHMLHLCNC